MPGQWIRVAVKAARGTILFDFRDADLAATMAAGGFLRLRAVCGTRGCRVVRFPRFDDRQIRNDTRFQGYRSRRSEILAAPLPSAITCRRRSLV